MSELGLDRFMTTMVGHSPPLPLDLVASLVREAYGLTVVAERLSGEPDENFRVSEATGRQYVLKVASPYEDSLVTQLATAVLLHMEEVDPDFPAPHVCRDLSGRTQIQFNDPAGVAREGRLVAYMPGTPLRFTTRSRTQRINCGRIAARLARALRTFEHPASRRALIWDLRNIPQLPRLLEELPDLPQAAALGSLIAQLKANIAPRLAQARHQLVHNDLNSGNVLVDPANESVIAGVIDFGDAVHTALVADVAIAAVAQITAHAAARAAVADLVEGYQQIEPLLAPELEILHGLVAARMISAVIINEWHRAKNPGSEHFTALDADFIHARVELARQFIDTPFMVR